METNIQQTVNVNNGWLKGRPEHDGTYLVVLDDYTVTTLDYECWEGEWDGISNDGVLYWQPFPEPPEELKK